MYVIRAGIAEAKILRARRPIPEVVLDPATGASLWSKPLPPEIARNVVGVLADGGIPFIATHPGGTEKSADEITTWVLTRISGLDMREEDADKLVRRFETEPSLHVVKASLPYNGLWAADFTCAEGTGTV